MSPTLTRVQRERQRANSILLPKQGQSFRYGEPNKLNPRCAIYVRLSEEDDKSVSTPRQRATLEHFVLTQLNGVYDPDTDYFEDYDLSAKGTEYRPAMEKLLALVQQGVYDGVVIWEFSRGFRNTRESSIAMNLLRESRCELYSHLEPHLTLYGPMKYAIEFAAEQAEKEIEKTAARVSAAHEYLASYGATMSAPVFGMELHEVPSPVPRRTVPIKRLRPDEQPNPRFANHSPAALVREATARLIAGESIRQVVLDWQARGIRGVRADSWSIPALRNVVRNPRIAGYAVFRGALVRDDNGVPLRLHEPVVDQETWDLLEGRFSNGPKKRRATTDSLLRGLLRCGRCGSGMMFAASRYGGSYVCWRMAAAAAGCIGNSVSARRTNQVVQTMAAELLAQPALLEPIVGSLQPEPEDATPLLEQMAGLQRALTHTDVDKAKGLYDDHDGPRRYAEVKKELLAELGTVTNAHRRLTTRATRMVHPALSPDGSNLITALDGLSKHQLRAILLELIDEVCIGPTARTKAGQRSTTGGRFNPARVQVTWRTADA